MKQPRASFNQLKFLSSMCEDETPLRGRIAILSAEIDYTSDIVNRIIVFIEHAQSVSLFFITNYKAFGQSNDSWNSVHISTLVYYLSTLLGPGNILVFDHDHINQIFSVLGLAFCFFILRILLFMYIVYLSVRKKEGSKTIVAIWRMIFKVQCRILYYLMASLWVNTASAALANEMDLEPSVNYFILVISTVMLVLEYAFAIFLQTQFEGFLPSKCFLASKSNVTEMITLTQKFADQILRRILLSVPSASIWVNNVFLVILSVIRLRHYLHFLPPYRVCSLRYQAFFLVVVFCLNIACLCQNIFGSYPVNLDFVVFLWIAFSVLMVKYIMNCLDRRILKLVLSNEIETPETLLHRVIIIKEIFKQRTLPDSMTAKISIDHLLISTLSSNLTEIFGVSFSEGFDWSEKEKREALFTMYLEGLLRRFPRNILLRLYTAYHYAKKRRFYGLCIKTLSSIKHLSSWRITVSIAILFENIKTIIQYDYHHGKDYLFNIDEYAQSTSFVAQLKVKMAAQSQFQIDLCHEITGTQPNLQKIVRSSQGAVDMKNEIAKYINRMEECVPDYYLEPLMICAHYQLLLNHKYEKYIRFCESYLKRLEKYSKVLKDPELRIEQFYQEDAGLMIVSGESKRAGIVLYCGGNFKELLGMDITGTHLSSALPPSVRFEVAHNIRKTIEEGALGVANLVRSRPFCNTKGYMTYVCYYTNISAYTPQGLVYYFIYQPLKEFKETILVDNEGYIETFTKGVGRKLGLLSEEDVYKHGEIHIGSISSELSRVNLAFHLMTFPEKFAKNSQSSAVTSLNSKFLDSVGGISLSTGGQSIENFEKAKEICSLFTEKGGMLTLYNVKSTSQKGYQYHCKITSMVSNGNLLKFIELDEIKCNDDSSDSEMDCPDEKLPSRTHRSIEKSHRLNELIPLDSSARRMNNTTRSQIKYPTTSEKRKYMKKKGFGTQDWTRQPRWLTSSKIQLSKVFEEALNKEHYPSFYKISLVMFIALFVIIFVFEIILHSEVNSCIPTLDTGKDILQIIQTKSRSLARLNAFVICLENYATGKIVLSDYDPDLTVDYFVNMARTEITEIEDSNTNLVDIISTMPANDALPFFEANVQVFQTYFDEPVQISSNVTIFQAVSQIAQSTLQALPLFETGTNTSFSEAIPYLQFVLRNAMNNILINNELIDTSLQGILQEKRDKTLERFTIYSIVLLVGLLLVIFLCCYLSCLQYSNEKRSMLAVLKLKKTFLRKMASNIGTFQILIHRNVNFLMTLQQEVVPYLEGQNIVNRKASSKSFQTSEMSVQSLSLRPLRFTYYCIVLKATSFIVISILFVIANIVLLKISFDDLQVKAYQLHSLDKMNSQVILTASIFQELVVGDSFALVKDTPLNAILVSETERLSNVIHEFTGILTAENPDQVSVALFEDGCRYLKEDLTAFVLCKQLAFNQENSGLISLLANYESILSNFYTKYMLLSGTIDHDTQVSLQLEVLFDIVYPCFRALRLLNLYVFNLLDENLDRFADGIIRENNGMTASLLVSIFVSCSAVYFMGIVKLRKKESEFKELLQLFPADVVLSNFMLKSYIMRISKGRFDLVRDIA